MVKNGTITAANNTAKACGYQTFPLVLASKTYGTKVTGIQVTDVTMIGGLSVGGSYDNNPALYQGGADATIMNCNITSGSSAAIYAQCGSSATVVSGKYTRHTKATNPVFYAESGNTITVSGGIFSEAPNAAYLAEGLSVCANMDSATKADYPYTVAKAVASITSGETTSYYATLESAIAAASDNDTIKLLADITPTDIVKVEGKTITIDLAGMTISRDIANASKTVYGTASSQPVIWVGNGANLTMNDSVGGGVVKTTSNYGTPINVGKYAEGSSSDAVSTVTLNGGTYYGSYACAYIFYNGHLIVNDDVTLDSITNAANGSGIQLRSAGADVTINGGTIKSKYAAVQGNGNTDAGPTTVTINGGTLNITEGAGLYIPQAGTVTITGGTITAPESGVAIKSGTLNITGGTIICTGDDSTPTSGNSNGVDASGAVIQIESNKDYAGSSEYASKATYSDPVDINITGGTFTSTNGVVMYEYLASGTESTSVNSISVTGGQFKSASGKAIFLFSEELAESEACQKFVSGGVFSVEPDAAYLAAGYSVIDNPDASTKIAYPYAVGTKTEGIVIRDKDTSTEVKVDVDTTVDYDVDVDESKDLKIPEDVLKEIENKTVVQGLELQPNKTSALGNVNGVQAVVDAAKEQAKKEYNNDFTNAVAASSSVDTVVTVDVDVIVTPIAYDADNKTVKFDLTPYATVSIRNAEDATATQKVEVTNEMINTAKDITVRLYTVTEPLYLLHKTDDGGLIDTYYQDTEVNKTANKKTFSFDSATGICTVVINHFSIMEPVNTGAAPTVVAKIGEIGYSTLQAAVDVVKTGETIEITALNTEDLTVSEEKTFTISGSTFNTPAGATGITVTVNKETGVVTATEIKHTVKLTSRIAGTGTTVVPLSGGGTIGEATGTTVYAPNKDGYKFLGWYVRYAVHTPTTEEPTKFTYTRCASESNVFIYKPQDSDYGYTNEVKDTSITLYAVYEPDEGTKVQLTVNASSFSIRYGAKDAMPQDTEYQDTVETPVSLTLTYTGSDKFLYWRNSSYAIVSTSKTFTTVLISDSEFTAVTADNQTTGRALVVFMNAEENGQQLKSNYYTNTSNITYPANPNKYGKMFKTWMATSGGAAVEATTDSIHKMISDGATYIVVYADYTANAKYTVTVMYQNEKGTYALEDDSGNNVYTIESGDYCYVDVNPGQNRILNYWMIDGDANNPVSTTEYYAFIPTKDTTITAVLVKKTNSTIPPIERVTVEDVTASMLNGKYTLTLRAGYTIDNPTHISKIGFLYWTNSNTSFTYGNKDNIKYYEWDVSTTGENSGTMVLNVKTNSEDAEIYYRAFVYLADGSVVYSDLENGKGYSGVASYQFINKG